ncbi:MAG: response regulator, partial [Candidatus Latescibacteria bacterium]|nr:response regulator [Candidatus Latescibacterota bacterium]
ILINLLGNAVKFTQTGEVRLRVSRAGDQRYCFAVNDTGPGISASEQATIFQAFQQGTAGLRQGGTGLGLAISQRQLRLMDSQLQVASEVGKGSCFSFAVELSPAQGASGAALVQDWSRVKSLAAGHTVKALVADDVAENREILASMLGGIGVAVEVVENGQQALERLGVFAPDIVFLDIRMPVLDGLAAVKLIQGNEAWKQVKVIAISASVLEHERQEYLQAGFDDFIDKPFSFERICQCLAQQLGVKFEYGKEEGEVVEGMEVDWSEVSLPGGLYAQLLEAAELYSVTELEHHFGALEALGGGPQRLAVHLRGLRNRHDLEAILQVVQQVQHE